MMRFKNYIMLSDMIFNKRFRLALLLLLPTNLALAHTYYFSSVSGKDTYNRKAAQSPLTPWKTLKKFNIIMANLKPGDSILFKRGETFTGRLSIKISGTALAPIVIAAYGTGRLPIISGLKTLKDWHLVKPGIYQSRCQECQVNEKLLILNGVVKRIGRFPNTGYLTYQGHSANKQISCKSLGAAAWKGADIVIRKNHWIIDKIKITGQTGGKIDYSSGTTDVPSDGFGCFVQNDPGTLDAPGEWYFNPETKNMQVFFGTQNPGAFTVKTSIINDLVFIDNANFISFKNILFEGGNESAFKIQNSKAISISNCSLNSSGTNAVSASAVSHIKIESCLLNQSLNDAITLDENCSFASIRNNKIRNTGLFAGMGGNGTGGYTAIMAFGSNSLIEFNEIDSTGYDGIYPGGNRTIVKNNLIKNFCLVKDDGAGIYVGDWKPWHGKIITGNIILNGRGATQGTNDPLFPMAEGIYADDNSGDVQITFNTVSGCADAGIKIHNAHNVVLRKNVLFNNLKQLIVSNDRATLTPFRNIVFKRNIVFPKSRAQLAGDVQILTKNTRYIFQADSNDYAIPETNTRVFRINIVPNAGVICDIDCWKEMLSLDEHATIGFPVKYDEKAQHEYILFEYNATQRAKLVALKHSYMDMESKIYTRSAVLQPYSSILLVLAKNQ